MEARFEAKLQKYGADPEARQEILKRRDNALESQRRVEALMGRAISEL